MTSSAEKSEAGYAVRQNYNKEFPPLGRRKMKRSHQRCNSCPPLEKDDDMAVPHQEKETESQIPLGQQQVEVPERHNEKEADNSCGFIFDFHSLDNFLEHDGPQKKNSLQKKSLDARADPKFPKQGRRDHRHKTYKSQGTCSKNTHLQGHQSNGYRFRPEGGFDGNSRTGESQSSINKRSQDHSRRHYDIVDGRSQNDKFVKYYTRDRASSSETARSHYCGNQSRGHYVDGRKYRGPKALNSQQREYERRVYRSQDRGMTQEHQSRDSRSVDRSSRNFSYDQSRNLYDRNRRNDRQLQNYFESPTSQRNYPQKRQASNRRSSSTRAGKWVSSREAGRIAAEERRKQQRLTLTDTQKICGAFATLFRKMGAQK